MVLSQDYGIVLCLYVLSYVSYVSIVYTWIGQDYGPVPGLWSCPRTIVLSYVSMSLDRTMILSQDSSPVLSLLCLHRLSKLP